MENEIFVLSENSWLNSYKIHQKSPIFVMALESRSGNYRKVEILNSKDVFSVDRYRYAFILVEHLLKPTTFNYDIIRLLYAKN